MARIVQVLFGLSRPDDYLRSSLRFAPVQILVLLAMLAMGIADGRAFRGFHAAWIGATTTLIVILVVEYVLRNRELALREYLTRAAAMDEGATVEDAQFRAIPVRPQRH